MCVHHPDPFRLRFGDFEEARPHPAVEIELLLFEAVMLSPGLFPRLRPREPDFRRQVEQDGQVRDALGGGEFVQRVDHLRLHAARAALVGGGRVEETVAEHYRPRRQRRADHFAHMLGTGRFYQQQFGGGVEFFRSGVIFDHRPEPFGQRGPAGLAGEDTDAPFCLQIVAQKPDLGAFPRSFRSFKGDESAGMDMFQPFLHRKSHFFSIKECSAICRKVQMVVYFRM